MSSRPDLRLAWCDDKAARYAVEHWHYSRTMPVGKRVRIGVWEDHAFIGAVIFGLGGGGAGDGRAYGLARNFEAAELERIALCRHRTPVSRIVRIATAMLKRQSPGLRLLVSYADPGYSHHGGIYQAAGWLYVGMTADDWIAVDEMGRRYHSRIARGHVQFGCRKVLDISTMTRIIIPGKHKYLLPLDAEIRQRILPLAKPYPKRVGSETSDTPAIHAGEGGAAPTPTLQLQAVTGGC